MSLLAEIVFFFLTVVAVAAADVFLPGWLVMLASIGTAEFLIQRRRFWRTGVESALWISGLYAFIFSLPSSGRPEALLVLASAAAIAGLRVRNALFGTAAVVLTMIYFAAREWPWVAIAFALTISLLALLAVTRAWKRPSTELLWQLLLLLMPIAGFVVRLIAKSPHVFLIYAALAVVFAFVGIRWRLTVPLAGSAIALAIAAVDVSDLIPLAFETQLIAGGAVALATAAALTRALRKRNRGFVLDLREPTDLESVLTGVAPSLLVPHAPSTPQPVGGGGEFGGAGSSGGF